jgi:hypothetical protein
MKKKTSFTLDEQILERLELVNKATRIPKAQIVEMALEETLARLEKEIAEKAK